tara:strand:- start:118 stop:456 length:339 start_codon:yes stop_codon:yes gene_type:complete
MINPEQTQKLIDVTIKECKDCMERGDAAEVNALMVNVMNLDGSVAQAKQQISSDPSYLPLLLEQSKIGKISSEEDLRKYSKAELLTMARCGWILMALEKEGLVKLPWKNQNE